MSPSATSSPVLSAFPDLKAPPRSSPAPTNPARPASSRARQNSTQSNNVENGKARPQSVTAPAKQNGSVPGTPDLAAPHNWPKPTIEAKVTKEPTAGPKADAQKKEPHPIETASAPPPSISKTEVIKAEESDRRSEPAPIQTTTITTVTKSGRASKPSTPALAATFQDAARSRTSRASETATVVSKRTKKPSAAAQLMAVQLADEEGNSSAPGEEDGEAEDPDEPTFCYCNRVSFGEMIACDADGCEKEWFHLSCVGMKVAPKGNSKPITI